MIFDIDNYVISDDASIKQALKKIEDNHLGFVFTGNEDGKVSGLATDGDIRRALLDGAGIEESISKYSNPNFVSANRSTPREQLIKRLDGHIQFIPLLDDIGRLTSIISKDYLPLDDEKSIYIRSRAPVRVSFGGGGSDLTHYFENSAGAVVNTAV